MPRARRHSGVPLHMGCIGLEVILSSRLFLCPDSIPILAHFSLIQRRVQTRQAGRVTVPGRPGDDLAPEHSRVFSNSLASNQRVETPCATLVRGYGCNCCGKRACHPRGHRVPPGRNERGRYADSSAIHARRLARLTASRRLPDHSQQSALGRHSPRQGKSPTQSVPSRPEILLPACLSGRQATSEGRHYVPPTRSRRQSRIAAQARQELAEGAEGRRFRARERLAAAWSRAPASPTLRDVQHALALEHGFTGWAALKEELANRAAARLTPEECLAIVLRTPWEAGHRSAAARVAAFPSWRGTASMRRPPSATLTR